MKEKARRRRGIDYNREVAFEKAPAAGFFDTGSEKDRTREIGKEFRPATLEEMEGRRRKVCAISILAHPCACDGAWPPAVRLAWLFNCFMLKSLSMIKPLINLFSRVLTCTVWWSNVQDIEANLMKSDEQKAKLKEAHNQPAAVAKAMELNDASAMRRRGRMMLPTPQVRSTCSWCLAYRKIYV